MNLHWRDNHFSQQELQLACEAADAVALNTYLVRKDLPVSYEVVVGCRELVVQYPRVVWQWHLHLRC